MRCRSCAWMTCACGRVHGPAWHLGSSGGASCRLCGCAADSQRAPAGSRQAGACDMSGSGSSRLSPPHTALVCAFSACIAPRAWPSHDYSSVEDPLSATPGLVGLGPAAARTPTVAGCPCARVRPARHNLPHLGHACHQCRREPRACNAGWFGCTTRLHHSQMRRMVYQDALIKDPHVIVTWNSQMPNTHRAERYRGPAERRTALTFPDVSSGTTQRFGQDGGRRSAPRPRASAATPNAAASPSLRHPARSQ